ncbi:hypothetical protein E5288_WYG015568 [Bos mutus]|uniref:Uncharacterized protein n=1 Tax=Bos mutus TaxID=72004 RepID=A0A6B0RMF0_9CETA|nr:hypothetical protein [Bos mutus]
MTEPECISDRLTLEATSLTLHHTESFLEKERTRARQVVHRQQRQRQKRAQRILSKCSKSCVE